MKTLKITLVVVLAVGSLIQSAVAQAQMSQYKFKQQFDQAFALVLEGDHESAIPVLEKLNKFDSEHAQVGFLLGMCQVKSDNVSSQTIEVLKKSTKKYDYYHQIGRVEDRTSPSKAWLYLAKACVELNHFDQAIGAYRNYMSCIPMASLDQKRAVVEAIRKAEKQMAYAESGVASLLASQKP